MALHTPPHPPTPPPAHTLYTHCSGCTTGPDNDPLAKGVPILVLRGVAMGRLGVGGADPPIEGCGGVIGEFLL